MNAVDYYTSLIDWVFSHARVLHEYMFLIQSIVTCTALFWFVAHHSIERQKHALLTYDIKGC